MKGHEKARTQKDNFDRVRYVFSENFKPNDPIVQSWRCSEASYNPQLWRCLTVKMASDSFEFPQSCDSGFWCGSHGLGTKLYSSKDLSSAWSSSDDRYRSRGFILVPFNGLSTLQKIHTHLKENNRLTSMPTSYAIKPTTGKPQLLKTSRRHQRRLAVLVFLWVKL